VLLNKEADRTLSLSPLKTEHHIEPAHLHDYYN